MPTPGYDVYVVDDVASGGDAAATDMLYLLSPNGPATPTRKRKADTGNATLDAQLRAYFNEGRDLPVTIQGYAAVAGALPTLSGALALLPQDPGQVVAPEIVDSAGMITLAGVWAQNKVALLNAPSGASDSALSTLAAAVIAGVDGRGAALFAETGTHRGATAGSTVSIPWSITVAALIARNDRLYQNPNLAAAGVRGVSVDTLALADTRSDATRQTLKGAQVNTAKIVAGQIRNYGFRTLANLTTLPHWWDLGGARTIMRLRAAAGVIDESLVFEQIDGRRILLDRYQGLLRAECKRLYDLNALFGATPDDAYVVNTSNGLNPTDSIASGEVVAEIRARTSPFAEHLTTNIVRRALTAGTL